MSSSHIVGFYLSDVPDSYGRTYTEMMDYSFNLMEGCHDYVQWLFPTAEKSKFSGIAPIVTLDDVKILSTSPVAKRRLLLAVDKFLQFLDWSEYPCDHNMLRITRIIRSLRLFGLETEALRFYKHVVKCYGTQLNLIETPVTFWKLALSKDPMKSLREHVC